MVFTIRNGGRLHEKRVVGSIMFFANMLETRGWCCPLDALAAWTLSSFGHDALANAHNFSNIYRIAAQLSIK